MLPINLGAVAAAAVTAFILGFLFHSPPLGILWMKLADVHPTGNEKFSDMIPNLVKTLLANFVTAFVLAVIYLFYLHFVLPGRHRNVEGRGLRGVALAWLFGRQFFHGSHLDGEKSGIVAL